MKKAFKRILCLCLCFLFVVPCALNSAVAVGAVSKIVASDIKSESVTVKWTAVSDVRGYRLYRYSYDKGSWSAVKTTQALTYTDNLVEPGKRYAYKVRGYVVSDAKVVYGSYSPIVYVNTPPEQVTSVSTYNASSDSVTLKWKSADGATGYVVYLYNAQSKKYVNMGTTSKTYLTVKPDKVVGSKFRVRAYFKVGKTYVFGPLSTLYTNNIGLGNVTNLKLADVSENSYKLTWNAVKGADGYQIVRYNATTKKWDYVKKTSATYYGVGGLSAGSSYVYKVRAYKLVGGQYTLGNYTSSITALTLPSSPKGLIVAGNKYNGLTITWNTVKGATGYLIYSYNPSSGKWELLGSTTKNYYFSNNLTETRNYTYRVRAFTTVGSVNYYGVLCPSASAFYKTQVQTNEYISALEESGVFGYLYDPAENCFYTSADPWQRNIGYNKVFDLCAPLTMINFDTERLYFTYGDKDWLVQLWKGQYGLLFYGAEVGVYYKPKDRALAHYDCVADDDMLKMSLDFYVESASTGKWSKKFTRPYGYYWWCTGFLAGNMSGDFDRLRYSVRITMKDSVMLTQFKKALDETDLIYTVNGLDVYITYA